MSRYDALLDERISHLALFSGTAESFTDGLRREPAVLGLQAELATGAIDAEEAWQFARSLLAGFQPGRRFSGDAVLAALVVSLEGDTSKVAEDLLKAIGNLKLGELPYAPRVARRVILDRAKRVVPVTQKTLSLAPQSSAKFVLLGDDAEDDDSLDVLIFPLAA